MLVLWQFIKIDQKVDNMNTRLCSLEAQVDHQIIPCLDNIERNVSETNKNLEEISKKLKEIIRRLENSSLPSLSKSIKSSWL